MRSAPIALAFWLWSAALALAQGPGLYTVTLIPEPPEGGIVTGEGTYAHGALVTVTAEPVPGFEFVGWWEEGVEVSPELRYTFTITSDRVLVARFIPVFFFEGVRFRGEMKMEFIPLAQPLTSYADAAWGFRFGTQRWLIGARLTFRGTDFTNLSGYLDLDLPGVRASGRVSFDPGGPDYRSSYLSLFMRSGILSLFGSVRHTPGELLYSLNVRGGGLSLRVTFTDTADDAFRFKGATLRMHSPSTCCGLTAAFTLSFTKGGFQYLKAKLADVFPLGCHTSLNLSFELTPTWKAFSLEPQWKYVEACLRVYGDVVLGDGTFGGFELYGLKISCGPGEGGQYPRLELVTAFSPERLPWARFEEGEFEYVAVEFRGQGCCRGTYVFKTRVYFSSTGSAFGTSRVLLEGEFPLFQALRGWFNLNLAFVPTDTSLDLGWKMSF